MANMPPVTICSGLSTTIGYIDATKTYAWASGQNTGQITVSPTTTTTYTVTVTETATGCSVSKSVTVTVNQTAVVTIAGGNAPLCAASQVTLTASTTTAGVTYDWGGGISTQDRTGLGALSHKVVATDAVKGFHSG